MSEACGETSEGDWSERQQAVFRAALDDLEDETRAMLRAAASSAEPVELDQTRVGRLSRMDAIQAQAMQQEAQRRRQRLIAAIEAARERLEEGEYGYCLACGDKMAAKRLELDPTAAFCVACAERERP